MRTSDPARVPAPARQFPGPQEHPAASGECIPPDGVYHSGWPGWSRLWDGQDWRGGRRTDHSAPTLHARRSLWATLRRAPFWFAAIGLLVGTALAVWAGAGFTTAPPVLLAVAGLLAVGGPMVALLIGTHRKLRISDIGGARLLWWGVLTAVVAIGWSLALEALVAAAAGHPDHQPGKALVTAFAGPAEETGKLLLPVLLLLLGARWIRNPRVGVWVVTVGAAIFGIVEGVSYAVRSAATAPAAAAHLPEWLAPDLKHALVSVLGTSARAWPELMHPFVTVGAAVLIWQWYHRKNRGLWAVIIGAIAAAAAMHAANDALLPLLPSVLPDLASIGAIVLFYTLWFRPMLRHLVPPNAIAQTPKRWLPRLPRRRSRYA